MPKKEDLRTKSIEDFLKIIYKLQKNMERVRTGVIATELGITAPSVHDFINRCKDADLIDYVSHRGVRLTPQGERIALQVLRNHRLLELYLVEALGYAWDEVHEEADALEHHISDKFVARIAAVLGNPTIDPHGDPIPTADGTVIERGLLRLADLPADGRGTVSRILDQSAETLQNLGQKGLILGAVVRVVRHEPYDGLTHLEVDGVAQVVGEPTTQVVLIQPLAVE